jgi:hypothetical protein
LYAHGSASIPLAGAFTSTFIPRLKFRIPAHPHHTSAFFATRPILTDYHSGIRRDSHYLQLYFFSTRNSYQSSLPFSFCLGCHYRCLRRDFFISSLALFGFCRRSPLSAFGLAPLSSHCFGITPRLKLLIRSVTFYTLYLPKPMEFF